MVVVLFRSKLTEQASADYAAMATEMVARARTMAGFVDFKSFQADDGERLSVIHWESQESMRAWSTDLRHIVARRLGREVPAGDEPDDLGRRRVGDIAS